MIELRQKVGDGIWLLIIYVQLAAARRRILDSECARWLGVEPNVIPLWRDKLVRAGLVELKPSAGGISVILLCGRELDTLVGEGSFLAASSEPVWPKPATQLVQ